MRVLINVPDLSRPGGVSSLFNALKIEQQYSGISLFTIHSKLPSIIGLLLKYIEFIWAIRDFDVVHINPSLNKKSFLRDAIFAWLTLFLSKKLVVYWHGWENTFETKIRKSSILNFIFRNSFKRAHTSIVLGKIFENKLKELGCQKRIVVETNCADSKFLTKAPFKTISNKKEIILLFIARLEKDKGIYEAIETLNLLNQETNSFKLIVAGTGKEEENIKNAAENNPNINYIGYVLEEKKHEILLAADILFFPTYYPEGLPLTILEGFIYGLPIISRPVGGIPDVVKNTINGYITESKLPADFSHIISKLVANKEQYSFISQKNLAKSEYFKPKVVCKRLWDVYQSVV
jgi:glycosyltransferase involved in cell wall biosynthesis